MFFSHANGVLQILKQGLQMHRPTGEIMTQLRHRAVDKAKAEGKIGRNDQCPCRSGRKYKQCCGMSSQGF
ncbi:MAG: hypothetical protein GY742_01870 [Hyphomicrobiales bacterium]|nr:hypothetical protein [Hyphomicrobiales bacterium]